MVLSELPGTKEIWFVDEKESDRLFSHSNEEILPVLFLHFFGTHSLSIGLKLTPPYLNLIFEVLLYMWEDVVHIVWKCNLHDLRCLVPILKFQTILLSHCTKHSLDIMLVVLLCLFLVQLILLFVVRRSFSFIVIQVILLVGVFHQKVLSQDIFEPLFVVLSLTKHFKRKLFIRHNETVRVF